MLQSMTGAGRWDEMLGGLVALIPAGAGAVIDGPPGDTGLAEAAAKIIEALNGAGRHCASGKTGERRAGEILIWVRTVPPRRGPADAGADADIVIDAHDPDWPVIRRVAPALAGRGPWYLTETRAFFACRAASWDTKFGDDMPAYAAAIAEAGIGDGGTVLDVGCGTDAPSRRCGRRSVPPGVVAVDLTPEMLERARPRCERARAALVLADARRLPLAGTSADAVFAAGLVTHLPDPTAGFAELARVVRPGGRLVLFHPSGRAALAARHGRTLRPDDPLAEAPLRRATAAAGWTLTAYDDAPLRFLALATRHA